MNFTVLTLFPEMFSALQAGGIIRRSIESRHISIETIDIRALTTDRHRTVDDRPYGGGCGMVMKPEPLAAAIAKTEDVEALTEDHWKVVNYLRDYYVQFGVAPMIRKLCKQTGFQLKEIYELFPSGPAKGACKVAGLPKPTGCV